MSEDINIQNINGICRLCLKDDGTIIPIFGRENVNRDCIPLSRKILACVSVEVLDKDSLPKMICVGCVHQIDSWHGFKTICDKSQEKLNTWLDKQCCRSSINTPLSDVIMGDCIDPGTEIVVLDSDDDDEEEEEMEVESDEETVDENMESHKEQIAIDDEITLVEEDSENCERPSDENRTEFVLSDSLKISGTCSLSGKDIAENGDILHSVGLVHVQTHVETNDNNSRETNLELTKSVDNHNSENSEVQSSNSDLVSDKIDRITESDNVCIQNGVDSNDSESVKITVEETVKVRSDLYTESSDIGLSETELIDSVLQSLIKAVEKKIDGENIQVTNSNENDKEYCKRHDSLGSGKETNSDSDSTSNNTKFVIHAVTSLAEHEVTTTVQNETDIIKSTADSGWQGVNQGEKQLESTEPEQDDSQSAKQPEITEPDLIVLNSRFMTNNGPDTYITGFHIKDEPLSEGEEVMVDEDPLNFSLLNIKKEPTDSADSIPDVKPNIFKLNAAIDSGRYNPQTRKSGKVYCEPCRSTFPNIYKYSRHAESNRHQMNIELFHTGGDPIMAKKKNKFLGLTSPYKLKKQILNITTYTPRDSGLFKCSQCFSSFTLKRNFIHHIKLKHYDHYVNGVKESNINDVDKNLFIFSCTKCNNKFPSNKILKLHTAMKHRDLESVCTKCNQEFPRRNALLSHMRFCGLKSSEHTCMTCSGIFTTTALFLAHKQNCRKERLVENHQEKQLLACTLCTQYFETTDALITHVQSNHSVQNKQKEETLVIENKPRPMYEFKPKPVLENKSKLVYENKPNAVEQNKKQTFSEEILYCKYCTRTFSNHGALSSHLGYHTRKESFECKLCPMITKTMKAFKQHMRKHLSERTECFMCWICYTPFTSADKLKRHKAVHIKLKIFTCNRCDNSYNSLIALTKHKKKVHGVTDLPVEEEQVLFKQSPLDEEAFEDTIVNDLSENPECKICKKRFSTIGNLKRHSILHLKIKKPIYPPTSSVFSAAGHYRCTNCSRMCGSSAGLKTHYKYCIQRGKGSLGLIPRSLKPRQSVRCDKCKQIFASKACLYKHRYLKRCPLVDRTKTSAFSCINCQKLFTTLPSLQRHLTHCNDGREKDTSCQFCGLKFSSLIVLSGHLQQCGQNVENNCCTICNENFTSAEDLEIHVQTCIPERIPSPTMRGAVSICTVCNKSFRYSKSMESHIFKNHPETLVDCPTCTQKFVSQIALNDHQIVCTEGQNPSVAETTMQNVQNSQDNKISHTLCYKCPNCSNVFNSVNDLEIHGMSCGTACESDSSKDTEVKVRIGYNCRTCGKRFTSRSSLYRHKIAKHTEVKPQTSNEMPAQQMEEPHQPYVCKSCPDIVFHKQKGFLEHMAWHNSQEKIRKEMPKSAQDNSQPMLTCELCDEQFANESLYQDHMEEHINNDVESASIETPTPTSSTLVHCDICNKGFGNKASLKSHRACHFRVKYSPSSLTNKDFDDTPMKKYKVKHVRCNVCYKLLSKNSIAKHKLIHLREDSFECNPNANQTSMMQNFPSQEESVLNNLTEDDTSPTTLSESHTVFPCTICNKLFRLRKSLHEHMKLHEENEFDIDLKTEDFDDGASTSSFYECKYCDLTWNHKNNYIRHLSTRRHRELQEQLAGII